MFFGERWREEIRVESAATENDLVSTAAEIFLKRKMRLVCASRV